MYKEPKLPLKCVTLRDVDVLHQMILAAIDETVGFNETFKSFEQARYNKAYLRALISANPAYATFVVSPSGEKAGFMLSGPESGVLVLYWTYLLPAFRKGALALSSMVAYNAHWDHGRFHKILAFTKVDNRAPQLLMRRTKYREIAVLKQHIYGMDFIAMELPLTKTIVGYDNFVGVGLMGRITSKLRGLF